MSSAQLDLYGHLHEWVEQRRAFVLATVIRAAGSVPRDPGAKMLIPMNGEPVGTVGGGRVELEVVAAARGLLTTKGAARIVALDLSEESACGGRMEIFLDPHHCEKQIVLIGAGHVGIAVARLLVTLDWDVAIIDPRAERLAHPQLAACRRTEAQFADAPAKIPFSEKLFILVMTPDHRFDEEVTAQCVPQAWRWLGVIGSRRKAEQFRRGLVARGLPEDRVSRVRIPVGIDIGSDTPEEIAISIAAELIRETSQKKGSPETHSSPGQPESR